MSATQLSLRMGAAGSSSASQAYLLEDGGVLLEVVKPAGQELGLGLTFGNHGALEVAYCNETSPFVGLIEAGDVLYKVNASMST